MSSRQWLELALYSVPVVLLTFGTWRAMGSVPRTLWRMVALEASLALVVLEPQGWFVAPWTPLHVISWTFLLISIYLVVDAVCRLLGLGKPRGWPEKTTVLVKSGPYRYIRHPMYASLVYFVWGAVLKELFPTGVLLALVATAAAWASARAEEAENLRKFGRAYADYATHTKMFVPFIW